MSSNAGGQSSTMLSRTRSTERFIFWKREARHCRIFYAFDPLRTAILLIGASKVGDEQFYERMIPIADRLYDEHLKELDGEARAEEK